MYKVTASNIHQKLQTYNKLCKKFYHALGVLLTLKVAKSMVLHPCMGEVDMAQANVLTKDTNDKD
jgi:hypothetical protein